MKSFSELTSASQVNNEDLVAISQTSGSGYASKKTTVKDITDKSNLNLAEEYDSTSTYAVDDYVIYESVLYKCISATTGTFDSTKWTSVVVTDEMGSGGGGTGGHTIIDENGNSMTARAGLQFVGANVDDDATNNKTIVDLANAGGIDGVFIDMDNVIVQPTSFTPSSFEYTATEDCFLYIEMPCKGGYSTFLQIDGANVQGANFSGSGTNYSIITTLLKKGQTATLSSSSFPSVNPDYAVYGIQTGTTHSKFQPVIYSTEEREVGVWEDGKPIYQKTWVFSSELTISQSSFTDTSIDSTDIENIVKVEAIHDDGTCFEGTLADPTKSNHTVLALQTSRNNNGASIKKLTLQYTKISDTAGSGTWTPQGVPAVHYSTDEQVIGIWIDGSTLYQKTIDCGALPNNATKTVNYNISNVQKFVGFEGVGVSGNGGLIPIPFVNDTTKDEDLLCIISVPNANIRFTSKGNKSAYNGYVTLRYIKSTS